MNRGDIVIARFPFAGGAEMKSRPVLVVQADYYNQRIANVLVASITTNLARKSDSSHFLIEVASPEGKHSGLDRDSVVSCLNMAVVPNTDVSLKIGSLPADAMRKVDSCLKSALGIA
jgi:mRNA-degrading endonuclease toxin of MazEF toxin-antitoxin module